MAERRRLDAGTSATKASDASTDMEAFATVADGDALPAGELRWRGTHVGLPGAFGGGIRPGVTFARLLKNCHGQAKRGFGEQAAAAIPRPLRHCSSVKLRCDR